MIEAVFDTNVFLQAAANENGPSHLCWKFVEERKVLVFITESILAEIEDVLTRPKVQRQLPRLTSEHVSEMISAFRTYCPVVTEPEAAFQYWRDKDDAKFIDLADAMEASHIVTRDRDLLDLMDDSEFCTKFSELKIVTPVGFLEVVRKA